MHRSAIRYTPTPSHSNLLGLSVRQWVPHRPVASLGDTGLHAAMRNRLYDRMLSQPNQRQLMPRSPQVMP